MKKVAGLHLPDLHIEKTAADTRRTFDNLQIFRSKHDHIKRADKFAEPALLQSVDPGFFALGGQSQLQLQIPVLALHFGNNLSRSPWSIKRNELLILGCAVAFRHRQNKQSLHEVCFALRVLAKNQVHIA
ncbi:hypothetical protein D3C75_1025860 [compost metagenome]